MNYLSYEKRAGKEKKGVYKTLIKSLYADGYSITSDGWNYSHQDNPFY